MNFPLIKPVRRAAFSLLELMVSVAMLAIIIFALLAMFNQVTKAFRVSRTQVDVLENGRAIGNLLSREVQEIVPVGQGLTNVYAETISRSAQELSGGEFRKNLLQDLFFVSRYNDEYTGTGYYVSLRTDNVGTLYKFTTNGPLSEVPYFFEHFARAVDSSLRTGIVHDRLRRVADGVITFQFRAYDTRGNTFTNAAVGDRSPLLQWDDPAAGFVFTNRNVPAALEMELAIIEPATLRQFYALPVTAAQDFLARNGSRVHLFRQRIQIRNAP